MCGIAGIFDTRLALSADSLADSVRLMVKTLRHRGPDSDGAWTDGATGIALGHRRLAIIDTSPSGAQPMASSDGRWVLSYNGEIYDHQRLRNKRFPQARSWRGHSDTETLLETVAAHGIDEALQCIDGMFAFALWDRSTEELYLVRDRLGIKPLYYASMPDGSFLFGSELKALQAADALGEIDSASLATYLRYGYVPSHWSIFKNVSKVRPGEIIKVTRRGIERARWWSLPGDGDAANSPQSSDEALDTFAALLQQSVSEQSVADVPLGVFLSGGIDSSLIAAQMVANGSSQVRSFCVGFPDLGYDETPHARAVAAHIGTVHESVEISASEVLGLVPTLADTFDEPFADASALPTMLLSQITRKHVTVALSGDGGDELFAGYNRHRFVDGLDRFNGWPKAARRMAARAISVVPSRAIQTVGHALSMQRADEIAAKIVVGLRYEGDELHQRLVSLISQPHLHGASPEHALDAVSGDVTDPLKRMRMCDMRYYLGDGVLQKVDRASMWTSLEVRPPFLDQRIVEFALGLPRDLLVRRGETKWLPRTLLQRYVPPSITDRPKSGFSVPLADWLRGPLKELATDLIEGGDFGGGLLNAQPTQGLWREHLTGSRNHAYQIWPILMFELWRRRWVS